MRIESALLSAVGVAAMLVLAPAAAADPPPTPDPSTGEAAPVAPPADAAPAAAASADAAPIPHLSSLENLPPGTATAPPVSEGHGLAYLRDLWHAVQTQDVSGADALLLLTQRPMRADSAPPPGLPAGPQEPPPPAGDQP